MALYDSKEVRAILMIAAENSSTDEPDIETTRRNRSKT